MYICTSSIQNRISRIRYIVVVSRVYRSESTESKDLYDLASSKIVEVAALISQNTRKRILSKENENNLGLKRTRHNIRRDVMIRHTKIHFFVVLRDNQNKKKRNEGEERNNKIKTKTG